MTEGTAMQAGDRVLLGAEGLSALVAALRGDGFRVIGPVVRDGAIDYADVRGVEDLPVGWTEEQEAGRYRLRRRDDSALFGYAVGPRSLKPFLFAPKVTLVRLRRKEGGFVAEPGAPEAERLAVIGARPCDIAAVAVQDRTFLGTAGPPGAAGAPPLSPDAPGPHADPDYAARRARLFIVAVQCGEPGGTCFCVSMGTGPRAERGFDLALTELFEGEHRFLCEVGTEAGAAVLGRVATRPAAEGDIGAALAVTARAAGRMGRSTPAAEHRELLARNLEHPRWDNVAARCLACTNCTMVCPTCFCSTVEDTTDLSGETAERARRWDSCFTLDHSYLSGSGPARPSTRGRYRQWLLHKLSTWYDQFGVSGCVGCGRCITWCPVGIDITEEVDAIRATDGEGARRD